MCIVLLIWVMQYSVCTLRRSDCTFVRGWYEVCTFLHMQSFSKSFLWLCVQWLFQKIVCNYDSLICSGNFSLLLFKCKEEKCLLYLISHFKGHIMYMQYISFNDDLCFFSTFYTTQSHLSSLGWSLWLCSSIFHYFIFIILAAALVRECVYEVLYKFIM